MVKPTNNSRLFLFDGDKELLSGANSKWDLDAGKLTVAIGFAGALATTYTRYRLVKIGEN